MGENCERVMSKEFMVEEQLDLVNCSGCASPFPKVWLKRGLSGARKVGFQSFCCNKCESVYFSQTKKGQK